MLAKAEKTGTTESYWVNDFVGWRGGAGALSKIIAAVVYFIIFKERLFDSFIVS